MIKLLKFLCSIFLLGTYSANASINPSRDILLLPPVFSNNFIVKSPIKRFNTGSVKEFIKKYFANNDNNGLLLSVPWGNKFRGVTEDYASATVMWEILSFEIVDIKTTNECYFHIKTKIYSINNPNVILSAPSSMYRKRGFFGLGCRMFEQDDHMDTEVFSELRYWLFQKM